MTEAERIEKNAREFTKGWGENCDLKSYIAGAKAENERLQQQVKVKEQQLNAVIRNSTKLMDELKSAQELNRELVEALNNYTGMASEYLTKSDFDYIDTLNKKAK